MVVGATTNHCVETTTRMAANLGVTTELVADATWTFARTSPYGRAYTADEIHDVTLTSLHGEFAEIVTTADVIARSLPARSRVDLADPGGPE